VSCVDGEVKFNVAQLDYVTQLKY